MLTRFVADPAPLPNGSCVVCGKQRDPHRSRKYGRAEAEIDPFCSTQCCRAYHGVKTFEGINKRVAPGA